MHNSLHPAEAIPVLQGHSQSVDISMKHPLIHSDLYGDDWSGLFNIRIQSNEVVFKVTCHERNMKADIAAVLPLGKC